MTMVDLVLAILEARRAVSLNFSNLTCGEISNFSKGAAQRRTAKTSSTSATLTLRGRALTQVSLRN